MLKRLTLFHLRHGSAATSRTAMRARRAMPRSGVSTVDVGHALLCNWVVRGFDPVTVELIFLFSEYIQILVNSKICVGFI
jgi:hypothetical protein